MTEKVPFYAEVWKRLRPQAIAVAVEIGEYAIFWAAIFVVHVVKVAAAIGGIEPDLIQPISFMEKWTWIATFAAFFWRVLMRVWRTMRS